MGPSSPVSVSVDGGVFRAPFGVRVIPSCSGHPFTLKATHRCQPPRHFNLPWRPSDPLDPSQGAIGRLAMEAVSDELRVATRYVGEKRARAEGLHGLTPKETEHNIRTVDPHVQNELERVLYLFGAHCILGQLKFTFPKA